MTPKRQIPSRLSLVTNRQIKQTLAAASAQFGHLNVPTCVFPAGKKQQISHVTGSLLNRIMGRNTSQDQNKAAELGKIVVNVAYEDSIMWK